VGGTEYGHHTLTRFFALHAGVLPALLVLFLVPHLALFRRHGIKAHADGRRPDQYFWLYLEDLDRGESKPVREVQLEIEQRLQRQQYQIELDRYRAELLEEANVTPPSQMVDSLVSIAVNRYAAAGES